MCTHTRYTFLFLLFLVLVVFAVFPRPTSTVVEQKKPPLYIIFHVSDGQFWLTFFPNVFWFLVCICVFIPLSGDVRVYTDVYVYILYIQRK